MDQSSNEVQVAPLQTAAVSESAAIIQPAPHYGGFWMRFLAYFVDIVLLRVITFLLTFGTGVLMYLAYSQYVEILSEQIWIIELVGGIVSLIVSWLYFAFFNSSKYQATPGKMICKLKIVDREYNRISFGRATGRFFSMFVSTLIIFIGYIMAGFTDKKRALHDMMAGTYVIYR